MTYKERINEILDEAEKLTDKAKSQEEVIGIFIMSLAKMQLLVMSLGEQLEDIKNETKSQ